MGTFSRLYYTPMPDTSAAPREASSSAPSVHFDTRLPELSAWRKRQIPIIGSAAYWLIRCICPTMQFEVLGWQNAQRVYDTGQPIIYAFWHRTLVAALWWWRHRGIVVMNSTNFDGQWTRILVERYGYGTAQGSSTRGGLRGLIDMGRRLNEGRDAAFTIDGPRGPKFVAKPGPVMLARRTGFPVVVLHVCYDRAFVLRKTWDQLEIPQPFSRCIIAIHPPIVVPKDLSEDALNTKHAEMQAALERCRHFCESWFAMPPEEKNRAREEWNT